MARYFLHLHESGTVTEDSEGRECSSLDEATAFAIETARDVMVGEVREGRLCLGWYITISDGSEVELRRIHFRDAVSIQS